MDPSLNAEKTSVERCKALDQSTAPFTDQALEAFSFAGLTPVSHEQLPTYQLDSDPSLSGSFNPKHGWALRWLLKRFDTGVVDSGSPSVHFEAWILLAQLVRKLPVKTLARLAQKTSFAAILVRTLGFLKVSPKNLSRGQYGNKLLGTESNDMDIDSDAKLVEPELIGKRKEDAEKNLSTNDNAIIYDSTNTFPLLISMSHALKALQKKISQNTTGDLAFAAHHIKLTLQCSTEDTSRIISYLSECIVSCANTSLEIHVENVFDLVVEPFLELWQIRKFNVKDEDTLSEARLVAKLLLTPISKIWQLLDPLSRACQVLQAQLISTCFQPYLETAISKSRGADGNRSDIRQVANDLASAMFSSIQTDSAPAHTARPDLDSKAFDGQNSMQLDESCFITPLVFRFAIMSTFGEKKKVGLKETLWVQELFKALASSLGFNIEEPSSSRTTSLGLEALHKMLLVLLPYSLSPGTSIIETIVLDFCCVSSEAVVDQGWQLIKLCIDLDYKVIVSTDLKETAAKGTQRILPPLLRTISATSKQYAHEVLETKDTRAIKFDLTTSLINAFVRAHALPSFIDVWEEQVTAELKNVTSFQSFGKGLWDDLGLCTEIMTRLRTAATHSQRTTLLEKRLSSLKSYPPTALSLEQDYAALMVSSCLLEAMSDRKLPETPLQTALDFEDALVPRLIDSTYPSRFKQALWRPMAMIYITCPQVLSTADHNLLLRKVLDTADETILGLVSQSQRTTDEYENGLSALTFLTGIRSICGSFDDSDDSWFAKSLQSVFHGLLEALDSGETLDSAPLELQRCVWRGEQYSISSNRQFALACCCVLVANSTALDVLDSFSVHGFVRYLYLNTFAELSAQEKESESSAYNSANQVSWYSLWQSLRQSAAICESSNVADAIRQVQLRAFYEESRERLQTASNKAVLGEFDVFTSHNVHELQPEKMSKDDRTKLANNALAILREGIKCRWSLQCLLYVLLRLSNKLNKGMNMVTRPSLLFDVAQQVDKYSDHPTQELPPLKVLTYRVLTHSFKALSMNPDAFEVSDFQTRASREINSSVTDQPRPATLTVLASAVLCSRSTADTVPAVLDEYIQNRFMTELIHRLVNTRTNGGSPDEGMAAMLEITASLTPILASTSEVNLIGASQAGMAGRQHLRKFFEDFKERIHSTSFMMLPGALMKNTSTGAEPVITKAMSAIEDILAGLPTDDDGKDDADPLRTEWLCFVQNPDEVKIRIGNLSREFWNFTNDKKATTLRKLIQLETDGAHLQSNELQLLHRLVGVPISFAERSESLKAAFGLVIRTLLESTMKETDMNSARAKSSILNVILSKNPWVIIQYHIDSMFALISILTSSSSKIEPRGAVRKTYSMLITLLRTIFTLHRPKTGGRYHLVIEALKGLLRCLYTPYETTKHFPQSKWIKDNFAHPKPVARSPPENEEVLDIPGPEESLLLSRLLTTITEPQPSTLKPTRYKDGLNNSNAKPLLLNDPTKKAKALAGQYLQYLVQEYCVLQLRGKMDAEVQKNLLDLGLYSVLGVMSNDVRKVCGEGLDSQARDVYRELIAGWRGGR